MIKLTRSHPKEQQCFSVIAIEWKKVFLIILDTCGNSYDSSNCDGIVFSLDATYTLEADSGIEGVKRAFFLDGGGNQVSQISAELYIPARSESCNSTTMYIRVSILNI